MNKKTLKLVAKGFLVLGFLLLIISGFMYISAKKFRANAAQTEGTVIEMKESQSTSGKGAEQKTFSTYAPVVSYLAADGSSHTYVSSVSSYPPDYKVGEKVPVYYDKTNPDNVQLGGADEYAGPFAVAAMGLAFILFVGVFFIISARKSASEQWLKQNGKAVAADFVKVVVNDFEGREINYFILGSWQDNTTNKLHFYNSELVRFDPTPFINDKKIDVYIDPKNPEKYYMDISFLPESK
ncbi:uncharacterized protein DUF3592 [Chitinophaga niastensis]|uniref:Uncharacterized protein DUF3592 n=1 Tax=Chitinophaga niastensis TaxID=536980 RepID=A0A2P8HCE2_CHINA|nr:DUF3592 domain-containing protein [Chitinophaga niastensis]PSL43896.1 uncharacterized protein DUF3592 [Chitinophaga niastensis]